MKAETAAKIASLAILAGMIFIMVGIYTVVLGPKPLRTKKRITPDIEIQIKNGVSDTTFIYNK